MNGPMGSNIQPIAFHTMPGMARGTMALALIMPALPKEQDSPGATGSITVTLWPSR